MNIRKIFSIFLLIMIWSTPLLALDFEISTDEIIKSIQNEPDQWVITDHKAVFFNSVKNANKSRGNIFPEVNNNAQLVISFGFYLNYAHLEIPRKISYKNNDLKKIIRTLKFYKYKQYKEELEIKDEVKTIIKEVERKEGMKKLY